jgi:hypothetical protein
LIEVDVRLGQYPDFNIIISSFSYPGIYGITGIAHKDLLKMQERPIGPVLPEC